MKKILAFSGSNNTESIHRDILNYIKNNYGKEDILIDVRDIREFETPYFSLDNEKLENPKSLDKFLELIPNYDWYIFASPEYNWWMPAIFKNLLDWVSRKSENLFDWKPLFSLSASPWPWAWINNREYMTKILSYFGTNSVAEYSIPSYYENMVEWKLEKEYEIELSKEFDKLISSIRK